MAKKKFYGVINGKCPNTGETVTKVFSNWNEANLVIKKVSGVEYKGFETREEANAFISGNPLSNKNDKTFNEDGLHCYVDGSFSEEKNNYSFGLICVENENILFYENGIGNNKEAVFMKQVGGELLGAMKSLVYARDNNFKNITIFHDYVGVSHHATGFWKRNNSFSEVYYKWMQEFFKANPDMKIQFCKVDAHKGDKYNELADGLAKLALNINPDNKFKRFSAECNLDLDKLIS